MSETMIQGCTCKHPFQDRRYGAGQRIHNKTGKTPGWRCTVCGTFKGGTGPVKTKG